MGKSALRAIPLVIKAVNGKITTFMHEKITERALALVARQMKPWIIKTKVTPDGLRFLNQKLEQVFREAVRKRRLVRREGGWWAHGDRAAKSVRVFDPDDPRCVWPEPSSEDVMQPSP